MSRPHAAERLKRLLAVIPWVASHQGSTLEDIAHRFGIPVNELERDLELVPYCGLPPYTPDRLIDLTIIGGEVSVRFAEYFDRPLRLTSTEAIAVLTAGRALLAVPGSDADGPLARAVEKLGQSMGSEGSIAVDVGQATFLSPLREAAARQRRLEIDYYSFGRDAMTTRRIDPTSVFFVFGQWYIEGYCHLAQGVRTFRLDRVSDVRSTGERFESYVRQGDGESGFDAPFHARPEHSRVTMDIPENARWVIDTYPVEAAESLNGGGWRVTLAVSEQAWLERLMLRLGPEVELIEPASLHETRSRAAKRILSRYR